MATLAALYCKVTLDRLSKCQNSREILRGDMRIGGAINAPRRSARATLAPPRHGYLRSSTQKTPSIKPSSLNGSPLSENFR